MYIGECEKKKNSVSHFHIRSKVQTTVPRNRLYFYYLWKWLWFMPRSFRFPLSSSRMINCYLRRKWKYTWCFNCGSLRLMSMRGKKNSHTHIRESSINHHSQPYRIQKLTIQSGNCKSTLDMYFHWSFGNKWKIVTWFAAVRSFDSS